MNPSNEGLNDQGLVKTKKYADVLNDSEIVKRLDIESFIGNIFGTDITQEVFSLYRATQENLKTSGILDCLQVCVRRRLESIDEEFQDSALPYIDSRPGKLGCREVRFDVSTHVGLFVIGTDRLSINSQSNFSTLRANACFFKGKWQYEVQLGSKGVMQIGWAMADCKFSQEIGVGDTINSYSYDGHRVRRWNVSTYSYGEPWLSGDIIGSTIDLDAGSIVFYRNGRSLGEAFDRIQMGPGYAYFPAVSLAFTENLVANFGSLPLKYPVAGFQTPQKAPKAAVIKTTLLLDWFQQLIAMTDPKYQNVSKDGHIISQDGTILVLGNFLIHYLAPLLHNSYIVEACFVPFLISLGNKAITPGKKLPSRIVPALRLNNFLDMFWMFMEESEQRRSLEVVASCMQARFRRVSCTTEYFLQKETLQLLILLFRHPKTRFYFLQNILFDKGRFANFSHVKPLDDKGLVENIPDPWWEPGTNGSSHQMKFRKYVEDCDKMKVGITSVELLQVDLMLCLLDNSDGTMQQASSRRLFLSKFRLFLQENFLYSRSLPVAQTPLPITLCCFHRLISCAQILCEKELKTNFPKIPIRVFYDGTINYFNIDRFGGVLSHLQKLLRLELIEELGPNHPTLAVAQDPFAVTPHQAATGPSAGGGAAAAVGAAAVGGGVTIQQAARASSTPPATPTLEVAGTSAIDDAPPPGAMVVPLLARMLQGQSNGVFAMMMRGQQAFMQGLTEKMSNLGAIDSEASIIEFIDGLVLFYHLAAHKQLAKVTTLRDSMEEYELALAETKRRLEQNIVKDPVAVAVMEKTVEVFQQKLKEQSRHMAWVRAAVYSPEKQAHLVWLLKIVISTLQTASAKGKFLSFVPEFYLDVLVELTTALKNHFHPTVPIENIEGYRELLMDVGHFLCVHFADPRIVHASSKDTLIQALANFVCNPTTLHILEELSANSQVTMVRGLLRPYENRAWAQSNWILVRFWQGNGFAFRFKKSPHLSNKMGPKISGNDTTLIGQAINPCPSSVFQKHVRDIMLSDEKLASGFINSVLNQLNWAFSEFIGMLQEIQNLSTRPERVFIESRQLKICATCFDLTLALLRVLEMIANIAQPVFSDMSRPSSESLLERICQLLCQILNRISSLTGCFQYVVTLDIPDLEAVDHFPILSAVTGILVGLLTVEMNVRHSITVGEENEAVSGLQSISAIGIVSRALLIEPSFQLSSLLFLIDDQAKKENDSTQRKFSFHKYPNDVTSEEIQTVRKVIDHLTWCQHRLSLSKETDEDALCAICYACATCATFSPCSHQSCRSCITHHLMNNQDCFFCKTPIQKVTMVDGKILFEATAATDNEGSPSSGINNE
ncbi:E3 ubiquitin-protein ligase RNF123-like isoform X2 [Lycorma delicatula]|uniref:E3 ubiquitin-protein ligase RNF123-like isoform X2 n=1 Tax=Lycorma delicatula TaxID=130591 RepID=UPI003F515C76